MEVLFLLLGAILWSSVAISVVAGGSGDTKNRCGIRKRNPSNGDGPWPWHATLYYDDFLHCAGSLIDQHHVLTSASCVTEWYQDAYETKDPSKFSIFLGADKLYFTSYKVPYPGQIRNISQIIVHPEYKPERHDIALLVLSPSHRYSKYVIPICIAGIQSNQNEELISPATLMDENDKEFYIISLMLIANTTSCAEYGPSQFETFCPSIKNGTGKIEPGDGLYIFFNNHWELRGITLNHIKNHDNEYSLVSNYAIVTNATYYYEWIRNETGFNQRASELKCRQVSKLARTHRKGQCVNEHSPHIVYIVDRSKRDIISGSIISEKFMLSKIPNMIDVFLNFEIDCDDLWILEPRTKITNGIYHPKYDPETLRYDVMLIELASPLTFTNDLIPICLADLTTKDLGQLKIYIGHINSFTKYQIISNEECQSIAKQYYLKFNIYSEDICVKQTYGSSIRVGSPLHVFHEHSCMFTQIGVFKGLKVSLDSKGIEEEILVFSRVSAYPDWIEQIVWGNNMDFYEDEESVEPTENGNDD